MLLLLLYNRNQRDPSQVISAGNSFSIILGILMLVLLAILAVHIIFFNESAAFVRQPNKSVPQITLAASFNNVTEIERLLGEGAYVDEVDWVGQTALHMAAKFGHPEACLALLKHGANPMAKNADFAETPLHNIVKTGDKEIFHLLSDRGVDINAYAYNPSFPGGTPLIYGVEFSNSVDVVRMLLDNGANVSGVNALNQTSLHLAVLNSNFKIAELILQRGGNVNAKDVNGNTALNWLAEQVRPQIPLIALLVNYSADVNTENAYGKTPIQQAAELNNFPVILYLLSHGGNWDVTRQIHIKDDHFPYVSHLSFASAFGNPQVVEMILRNTPGILIDERDWLGQTALHTAAIFGRFEAVKVLMQWHPDVNALDGQGFSPLHHAAKCGDHELLQLLINAHADITLVHSDHGTPLSTAVRFADAFIYAVKVLLQAEGGTSVINTPDTTLGYTPLHWAALNQNLRMMDLLLKNGADVEAKTTKGESPLNLLTGSICCYPQFPAVQFLLDHGADINSPDFTGCTPLCKAKNAGKRKEVLQYLIDRGAMF